jgi:hypothetical protein
VAPDLAAGSLHGRECFGNVCRSGQAKPEVRDAPTLAGPPPTLEYEYVAASRRLCLNEVVVAVNRNDTEDALVELERARGILDSKGDVRKAVGLDHGVNDSASRRRMVGPAKAGL